MLGSKFMDVVIGVDLHLESVPTPVGPIPLPFPQPFMGMIFDPAQLASTLMHGCPGLGLVFAALDPIGTLVNMAFDKLEPGTGGGPVVINGMPATNTQSQVTTRYGVPHIVIPPGAIFLMGGKAVMEGDAMFPFGSSSVWINGRRAVRTLMDPVFSCSDPVRLPTSMTMPAPIGPPVLVGGAPTPDLQAIISSKLRHLVTSGIKNLIGPPLARAIRGRNTPTSRWRNIIGKIACFWTGHPVDVATGRMVTTMTDWELPGPLPLVFERQYSSAVSDRDGALGFGWNHTLDQSVWLERGKVVYRTGDGREIVADTFDFPGRVMRPGDQVFEPCDRLTFRRRQDGWEIVTAEGVTHEFRRVEGDRTPGRWRLTKMRSRDGHEIKLEYDKFGTLAWVQDCGGRVIRFTHDRNGRLTQIDLPHPTQEGWLPYVKYSYSKDGNLVAVEDPLGHTTRYEYSGHLMVRETDRTGLSFYFGYDGIDSGAWCVRTWGDGGIYDHQIDYDKAGLRTYVTNSLGHTTVYRINETLAVVEVIDAHGGKTQYEYDEALRRTAEIDPLGNATRYEYDAGGNRTKKIQPDGTVLSVEYDADNLPLRAVDAIGGEWIWVRETSGRLVELINPLGERQRYKYMNGLLSEWISAAGHRTAYTYDHHKNLIWIERPNGAKIRFDYDALGRRVYERDERAGERRISFNAAGHVLRVERPEGEIERRRFDAAGNLVEVKSGLRHVRLGYTGFHKPAWREEGGSRVTLRYDAEDRLTGVINEAGETYSFTFDALGRVVTEVGFDGATRGYCYDAAGRMTQVMGPDGAKTTLEYDRVARLTARRHDDGTFHYFRYRPDGALLEAENETGIVAFDRDGLGRAVKERRGDHAVVSQYDPDGLRSLVETSLGGRQMILRDALGKARALHLGRNKARQPIVEFERDEAGFEMGRQLPGGVRIEWRRDLAGRPTLRRTLRRTPTGAHETHRLTYRWEEADQLRELVDSRVGPARYTHDARGRLILEERPGTTLHRAMDQVGNIYRTADGHDRRYGRGGRFERADGKTYRHDASGNLAERHDPDGNIWRYHWNGSGLLREVERPDGRMVRFEYDAFARRTRKATVRVDADGRESFEHEVQFVWDGNVVIHELFPGHAPPTTWYWQPESFTPIAREAEERCWPIASDHLGAPTEMYDEAGQIAWRTRLDVFGSGRNDVALQHCPWRWPGQYFDEETGLHYNRHRYYDPSFGQYISCDPIGLSGGSRPYGYARNPVSWTDPLGLTECNEFTQTELAAVEEVRQIPLGQLRGAFEAGGAELQIGGRTIVVEPGMPASGMTLFGENGFVLGREAFTSDAELTRTLLHETHRLMTSQSAGGITGELATHETNAAFSFAERAYQAFFR